jgi:hypothetical protein
VSPITPLLEAWLAGDVTTLEAGRRIDRQRRELEDLDSTAAHALIRLFPPYPADAPEPAVVELLLHALLLDPETGDALAAIAGRRSLLEAVVTLAPGDSVLDAILRPGERVMLGTRGGTAALIAILNDDPEPFALWLGRTVIDPDAFSATTGDIPILDLDSLRRLIGQLADATETLAPGTARVMVADEWVAETTVAALSDDVTFAEVARAIGEELLDRDAPILLWHAAHELALVAEDDPDLRAAVLHRCLPHSESEGARCPAEAAAPLLRELGTRSAPPTCAASWPPNGTNGATRSSAGPPRTMQAVRLPPSTPCCGRRHPSPGRSNGSPSRPYRRSAPRAAPASGSRSSGTQRRRRQPGRLASADDGVVCVRIGAGP